MSTVSICIPTFNQAAYLEAAARSALAQTHPCELWISDDASTDATPAVVARLLRDFPQIQSIRHQQNLGMSGNPRWVVQQPRTTFVVKLDSDDELHPNYVATLLKSMLDHPTAAYAHAAVEEMDGNGQTRRIRSLARRSGFQSADESLRASVTGYRVAANICMFRQAALQEVDYYRHDLKFADDWDLAVRLADAGWGNVYQSEVLARYRVWDTSDKARSRRKLAEIEGCRRVLDESLIPAFGKRAWSLAPINKGRRRLALRQAECLRSTQFTGAETQELKQALRLLGNSLPLRLKLQWIATPIAPLLQFPGAIVRFAKTQCKAALFRSGT